MQQQMARMARGMVTQYGMSDKFGPMGLESTQNQYLDGRNVANHSEQTGALIDDEVRLARALDYEPMFMTACHDLIFPWV